MHAEVRCLLKMTMLFYVFYSIHFMYLNANGQESSTTDKSPVQSTVHICSYVMASGGIRSQSSQYRLLATAGEGAIGALSGPTHYMQAGYWNSYLTGEPVSVAIKPDDQNPQIIRLAQNYPNPFNPQTTFVYDLRKEASVRAEIYNSVGQLIRHFKTEVNSAGRHTLIWDARDDAGQTVGSGVYIFHFTVDEEGSTNAASTVAFQTSIKILLLK